MAKSLIIVESPAKVKTIKKFLGKDYTVQASVGHVRDLPSNTLGVDENDNFTPQYQIIPGKEKVVHDLETAAAKADTVYLAPDPDREGEAIAWHVAEIIKPKNQNIKRIQFNEITARAVREAIEHPRDLDPNLFDAQQARRILDRLVGYKISPLLWKKVKRGISAGRVQSVALRLIVDREQERHAFEAEEYWLFNAMLQAAEGEPFKTDLHKVNAKKPVIDNAQKASALEKEIKAHPFTVLEVAEKERKKDPKPPFITSTLQQMANQRLGYTAKRTMSIAQRLYEGLELGDSGTTALITYMRTDSVRIAAEALEGAQKYIVGTFGKEYGAPGGKRVFRSKGGAQDAHEAIRPIDVSIAPDDIRSLLTPEQYQLYKLIWARFVASQMAPARYHDTTVSISNGPAEWRVKGERVLFPGYMAVYPVKQESEILPPLVPGQELKLDKLLKEQKFTQPPARYNEASLVKELEEQGIGRPSTYASIISTLLDREYVQQEEKNFVPTDLGTVVCELLKEHFATLMDVGFTANMENNLDKIADGDANWQELLNDFAEPFNKQLAEAQDAMKAVKGGMPTGINCPECGKDLMIKFGKAGPFVACSAYPECTFTSNFERDEKGNIALKEREQQQLEVIAKCPDCGGDLVMKKARTGSRFIACNNYPNCKHAEPFSTGVPCPKCENGQLVEKSSKRGKVFYACDQYPNCDYAMWDWPINESCPACNSKVLSLKTTRGVKRITCPEKSCRYSRDVEDE